MAAKISDTELELMKIVWANGGNARYVHILGELLRAGRTWQKNTITTLLSRLVDKGLLTVSTVDSRNEYSAVLSEADYQAEQAQMFLDKVYRGSAKEFVSMLIRSGMLSCEEFEELKEVWKTP